MSSESASQVSAIDRPQVKCRMLRSKWMFIEAEPDPTVPRSGTDICWCVHTQKCIGPDGQIVNSEECTSDRACFEAL